MIEISQNIGWICFKFAKASNAFITMDCSFAPRLLKISSDLAADKMWN